MSSTVFVIVLGAILAGSAQAQDNSWLASRINGQALIRVSGQWGTRNLVQPHLSGRSFSYADIEPDSLSTPLTLDTIERIQVRENSVGRGALIGAGIGMVGGIALGSGVTSTLCNDGLGCSNKGGATALIALVSTAGGALLGALIGSVTPRWVTVLP